MNDLLLFLPWYTSFGFYDLFFAFGLLIVQKMIKLYLLYMWLLLPYLCWYLLPFILSKLLTFLRNRYPISLSLLLLLHSNVLCQSIQSKLVQISSYLLYILSLQFQCLIISQIILFLHKIDIFRILFFLLKFKSLNSFW